MYKFIFLSLLFLLLSGKVSAADLKKIPNNKFGIHLAQPNKDDLKKAAELVNSNNGEWGYVTLVVQENDRNRGQWQEVFDMMRELHLIPIIRLATKPVGANWRRPSKEDVSSWVEFLDSLTWVVKNRYIILFNEPNHATEWGGAVDPEGYADIARTYAKALKKKNSNYFIMLAGLDASAPSSSPFYEDEENYLRRIFNKISSSEFNELFSGLSSHSYPNPGFVGSPYGMGRGTVRTYQWELNLFRELGAKNLPVFITETGWDGSKIPRAQLADSFKAVFESVWLPDDQVIAVTPFVLSYLTEPFAKFSWIQSNNEGQYPQYIAVQSLTKQGGEPEIVNKGEITYNIPGEVIVDSTYHYRITLKNEGEAIWDKNEGYSLVLDPVPEITAQFVNLNRIKPHEEGYADIFIKTNSKPVSGKTRIKLVKTASSDAITVLAGKTWNIVTIPSPKLEFKIGFYPKLRSSADDVEIQVFDSHEVLVFKQKNVHVRGGSAVINTVPNITVGGKYRLVALKPYYVPRQQYVVFKKNMNKAVFSVMFPFDFNKDGAFSWDDIVVFLKDIFRFLPNLMPW